MPVSVLFGTGLYFIFAEALKVPKISNTRAILKMTHKAKQKVYSFDAVVFELANRLSKFIRIDDYKRRKTEAILKSAGIMLAPETYIAKALVKAGLLSLCIIPSLFTVPAISIIFLFFGLAVYFKEIKSADEIIKKKREGIENELPRFVATISQELRATRDILTILEKYKRNAGDHFRSELEITIADMQSGNQETALVRLESRMGSTMLSDAVRGLVSVIRGDNGVEYFSMLAHDFKQLEIGRLKLLAMKRPGKIRKYSFYMLGCFMLMYLTILFIEIINAFGQLF